MAEYFSSIDAKPTKLKNLDDVDTSTPTDGQALVFDSDTGLWKPTTLSGGDGGGEDLAATLILGNETDGKDIILSIGDSITSTDATLGSKYGGAQISISASSIKSDTQRSAAVSYLNVEHTPLQTQSIEGFIIFRYRDVDLRLTAIDGERTSGGNNFNYGLPASESPEAQAQEIADALNDPLNDFIDYLSATVDGSRINVVAKPDGHQGNRYLLTSNFLSSTLTDQGLFSGGWEADTTYAQGSIYVQKGSELNPIGFAGGVIQIGDVTLTAVEGPRTSGGNDFQIDLETYEDIFEDIYNAITDPANSFAEIISVTDTWANSVTAGMYIEAVTPGIVGNEILLTTKGLSRIVASGLEGGWEARGSILLDIGQYGSISVLPGGERRTGTIDLQIDREHDGQIARGKGAAILAGYNNMIDDFGTDPDEKGTAGSVVVGIGNTIQPREGIGSYGAFVAGNGNTLGTNSYGSAVFGSGNVVDSYGWPYCSNALVAGNGNKVISGYDGSSGSYNGLAVGFSNQIYGARDSVALGRFSYVGGYGVAADCSMAGGNSVTVRSYATLAWGFNHNTHPRSKGSALFGSGAYSYVPGQLVHTSAGSAGQASHYTLTSQTTNGTIKEMTLDSGNPAALNRLYIRPNSTYAFRIELSARQIAGSSGSVGDSASWSISGLIKRDDSDNTVLIGVSGDGTPLFSDTEAGSWSVSVSANDTNEALKVEVTGESDKTIKWFAYIYDAEVK